MADPQTPVGEMQTIAALQTQLVTLEQENRALRHQIMLYQAAVDAMPHALYWKDRNSVYYGCNRVLAVRAGLHSPAQIVGKTDENLAWRGESAAAVRAQEQAILETGQPKYHVTESLHHASGEDIWLDSNQAPLCDPDGQILGIVGSFEEITQRKQAEAEQQRRLEELVKAQAEVLAELSTPLIPLAEGLLVMPLIGSIDSDRARQIVETLLDGVSRLRAHIVILDVTGVRVVDTHVANTLLNATQAVRLLGAAVWLTGVRPEVAQTLVHLGVELGQLVVRSTLQSAIAYALRPTAVRQTSG